MAAERNKDRLAGCLCVGVGLLPIALATGLIEPQPGTVHAPMWVIGVCGGVFVLAGLVILSGPGKKMNHVFAGLILLSFAAIAGWVALFGLADGFSGGIPFLPQALNVTIARWVFGAGSIICIWIFIYIISQLRSPKTQKDTTGEA